MPEGNDSRIPDAEGGDEDPEQHADGGFQPGSIHRVIMDTRERVSSVEEKVDHTEEMVEDIANEIDDLGDEIETARDESLDAAKEEKVENNTRFRRVMRRMGAIFAALLTILLTIMGILATLWTGWPL